MFSFQISELTRNSGSHPLHCVVRSSRAPALDLEQPRSSRDEFRVYF